VLKLYPSHVGQPEDALSGDIDIDMTDESPARRTAQSSRNRPSRQRDGRTQLSSSRINRAASDGVRPTCTPAASSASFFACAVPDEPDTIAPA